MFMKSIELSIDDRIDYLTLTDGRDIQEFLELLKEEGIYTLYETKGYKRLNNGLLFGVFLVVLTNIKLQREYKKTNIRRVPKIVGYQKERMFTCEVSVGYDVMVNGKQHLHEFLEYVMREFVSTYISKFGNGEEDTDEMRRNRLTGGKEDIIFLLVYIRHTYGRYSGREEYDLMVVSLVDEFIKRKPTNNLYKYAPYRMLKYIKTRTNDKLWIRELLDVDEELNYKEYGVTQLDKEVFEREFKKATEVLGEPTNDWAV